VSAALYQARRPADEGSAAGAQPLELGIVKDWLVLGPFATDDPVRDIEWAFVADEAALRPDDGEKVGALAWRRVRASIDTQSTHYTNEGTCQDFNVDFVFHYGRLDNQVAYAHTYIYSPAGGAARLSLRRAGAAAKIWVNGRPTTLNPKDWDDVHKSVVTLRRGGIGCW